MKRVRTPIGRMWLYEDGILWHRLDQGAIVTVEHARAVREAVARLTEGNPVPAIVDIRGVVFADNEARRAFGGSAEESNEIATAIIVASRITRTLGNLFMTAGDSARPVKLFSSEDEALEWIAEFGEST